MSYKLLPDMAVLDAETTYGLPPHVTAMTGVDAMIHALEAYTGKNLKNPLSDIYARSGLEIMSKNLLTCMDEPLNAEARSAMLYGSFLAATAFCNSPVSGVHALAYPLALKYHVPHGLSNSLMLPEVMRFNAPACGHQYDEILALMHDVDPAHLGDKDGQGLVWYFEDLIEKLGLPYNLKGISTPEKKYVGLPGEDAVWLAQQAMNQTRLLQHNPREITVEDALLIFTKALGKP